MPTSALTAPGFTVVLQLFKHFPRGDGASPPTQVHFSILILSLLTKADSLKQILPVCFHRLSQKSPERGASTVNSFEILKSAEFCLLSRENMIE